jgi:hypothetical protein
MLDREEAIIVEAQMKALDAVVFLPDHLMEEAIQDTGELRHQDMSEFTPSSLYMEQMMRIFPQEITAKYKVIPSFEESFMTMDESKGGKKDQM